MSASGAPRRCAQGAVSRCGCHTTTPLAAAAAQAAPQRLCLVAGQQRPGALHHHHRHQRLLPVATPSASAASASAASTSAPPASSSAVRERDDQHLPDDGVPSAYGSLAALFAPDTCSVAAGRTPLGRGLVCSSPVAAGGVVLGVDRAGILCVTDEPAKTGDALGREALAEWQALHGAMPPLLNRYLLSGDAGWFLRMTAWLLWLAKNGTGPWAVYSRLLPREREMTCLMNFDPEAPSFAQGGGGLLAEFQDPAAEALARRERSAILGLHERVYSSAGGELKVLGLANSPLDTVWGAAMVNSRSFSEDVGGEVVSLVVPCADFANHSNRPRATYRYNPQRAAFELSAIRPIAPGEEVTISYGCMHKDSLGLMKDYGFVMQGNVNDRLPLSAGDDVASISGGGAERLQLDSARLVASFEAASSSSSSSSSANGSSIGGDTSGGSEAHKRRMQAVLLSLKPFFGGGNGCSSSSNGGDGGEAWGDARVARERAVADALRQQCVDALAGMGTTIETDEALLLQGQGQADAAGGSNNAEGPVQGPRHEAAVRYRLERKRLLATGAAALENYARSL